MAALALYHRYGYSKKDKGCTVTLAEDWQDHARYLSLFLSLAEGMDKSHRQAVVSAEFARREQGIALIVRASVPCPVEQERLKRCYKALEKCFGRTEVVWESAS